MKNQAGQRRHQQSGSIFVWILIMISLFGALSFTMLQGGRTGTTTLTDQQVKLGTQELLNYAQQARDAHRKMRINGCSSDQISYANPIHASGSSFPNPATAPTNESCHLFKSNGGGLNYVEFSDFRRSSYPFNGFHYAKISIEGIGTTTEEEVFVISGIVEAVCEELNFQINGEKTIYQDSNFGTAINTADNLTTARCPSCVGKRAGCAYHTATTPSDPYYNFYYTLEAR